MNFTFNQIFYQLASAGIFDVLIPFLLVFAIVFALLEKIKIFGAESKKINIVIAIAFGLFFIAPHLGLIPVSPEKDPVNIIMHATPSVGVILVAIISILILLGIWSKGELNVTANSTLATIIVIFSFLVVIYLFGQAAGWFKPEWFRWLSFLKNPGVLTTILGLGSLVVGILFVTGGSKKSGGENIKNLKIGDIGKIFGGH